MRTPSRITRRSRTTSVHALGNQFIVLDKLRPMENEAGLSDLGLAFSRPLRARLAQGRRAA